MTAVQIRNAIFTSSVIGGGTFLLYKMIVPSSDTNPDRKAKSVAYQVDENPPEGPGAGSAIGNSSIERQFAEVIKLSQKGYSYEAITKIIGNRQKLRYQALYAQEQYDRKQALEAQRVAETRALMLPTFNTAEVIESAVQSISP